MSLTRRLKGINEGTPWFVEELEAAFSEMAKANSVRQPEAHLHPSSAYTQCPRDVELAALGYRGEVAPALQRKFDNGTYMHLRWTEYFKAIPSFVAHDLPIASADGTVRGTLDILLKRPDNTLVVGELKSINDRGFINLPVPRPDGQANLQAIGKIHPAYAAQILLYMKHCRWRRSKVGASEGFFLFENKNTQDYRVYSVTPNDAYLEKLTSTSREGIAAARRGELLPAPFLKTSLQCKGCWRRKECFALQDGNKELTEEVNKRLQSVKQSQV